MVINFVLKKKKEHLCNVYNIFSIDRWRFYAPIVLSVLEMSPRVLAHFRIYTYILSYYHYVTIVAICASPAWRTPVRDVFSIIIFPRPLPHSIYRHYYYFDFHPSRFDAFWIVAPRAHEPNCKLFSKIVFPPSRVAFRHVSRAKLRTETTCCTRYP